MLRRYFKICIPSKQLGVDIVADEEMHPVRYYLRNVPESELSEGVRAMVKERHDAKVGCWR